MIGNKVLGQEGLISAFGIDGHAPKLLFCFRGHVHQSTGEEGIGGAIGGQDQADGLERLANDQGHALLGGLQKEVAVNRGGETGDDDCRNIFERKFTFGLGRFADELAITATEAAVGAVDVYNVIGQKPASTLRQSEACAGLRKGEALFADVLSTGFQGVEAVHKVFHFFPQVLGLLALGANGGSDLEKRRFSGRCFYGRRHRG